MCESRPAGERQRFVEEPQRLVVVTELEVGLGQPLERQRLAGVGADLTVQFDTLTKIDQGPLEVARQQPNLASDSRGKGDRTQRAAALAGLA